MEQRESKNLSKILCITQAGEWSAFFYVYCYYGLQIIWGQSVAYDVYIKCYVT